MGLLNSWLLRDYVICDSRFRDLMLLVKMFVKTKSINKANDGCISSYGYTLLVVHFLQQGVIPSVLPVLYTGRDELAINWNYFVVR
jgi:DNA polymerase sigma